jgi:hypothetical protein
MAAKRTVEGIVSFAALIFAEQKKPAMGRKPQFVALSCTGFEKGLLVAL